MALKWALWQPGSQRTHSADASWDAPDIYDMPARRCEPLRPSLTTVRCRGKENARGPAIRWFNHANSSEGLIHFTTISQPRLTNPLKARIMALSLKCRDYEEAPKVSPLPFKSSLLLMLIESFLTLKCFEILYKVTTSARFCSCKGGSNWAANDSVNSRQTTAPPPSVCCVSVRVQPSAQERRVCKTQLWKTVRHVQHQLGH